MARDPKRFTLQDYKTELENTGRFSNEDEVLKFMEQKLSLMKQELDSWRQIYHTMTTHYAELDRLSNKKYRLFNVPTFKEDLNNTLKDFQHFDKTLSREMDLMNKKWAKATAEEIQDRYDEWMQDNNKMLKLQEEQMKRTKEMAKKAMEEFRNGSNVFDRFEAHVVAMFKGMNKGVNEVKTGFNQAKDALFSWVEPWAKANQAAADYAKNVGLGAAGMKNLLSETIRFANQSQIGIKYNKSLEEMIKLQQEYTNAVGRNIGLTDGYKESLAAMSAVMGDQKTADIAGKLENFGINPEETGKRMGKMFADASKKGIAFSKYSETFANNIKMAQNYTFANGVKGVASMAEKATKLKLEMQSVAQFAEKVSTVEGAITTGAKLQVLGGSFTQFADPLQMLYEGTSDVEGIQDRIINMFGDLGRFNKLTGEVEVSAFDRQRIKAAGEAIGVNSAELMDMIHAKGKRNEIANQMRGLGYSAELEELIMNTASFDENGNAGVSINGQFVGIDQLAGREQELIALNQSESEDIKEIATLLRGWDDTMQGFQKQKDAKQASWVEKSGIGSATMTAVQYLGQANWALNTIVGLLTAGKAMSFGMGAFGMLKGGTRTVAGAFQRARMNKFMKKAGLYGKDTRTSVRHLGKNIGVEWAPDGTFRKQDLDRVIGQGFTAQGNRISNGPGIQLGTPKNGTQFVPTTLGGTPSTGYVDPVTGGGVTGNVSGNPVATGTASSGNPLDMGGGNAANASSNPVTGGGVAGNVSGNPVATGTKGKKMSTQQEINALNKKWGDISQQDIENSPQLAQEYIRDSRRIGELQQQQETQRMRFEQNYAKTDGLLQSNQVHTLKNGTKIRMGDFSDVDENGYMYNKKTGQRLTVDKNGNAILQERRADKNGRMAWRQVKGGSLTSGNISSTRTSRMGAFKQQAMGGLKNGAMNLAGASGMIMSAGLSMGAQAVEAKRMKDIAEGKYEENSNEDWRKRNTSKALSWAGTGASIGGTIGSFFGPIGTLVGSALGGIIGGIGGLIKGKSEQKKEQEKARLLKKIARFRNGQQLMGDYDNARLSRIAKFVETNDGSHVTNDDLNALKKNGNDYNIVVRKKMAKGGLIAGPSHANGGVAVAGTGIEVEGGEFVMNRKATVKNIDILKQMNAGTNITPMPLNTQSMTVSPNISSPSISNIGPTEISLKPLDININGTIKLDAGKGQQIDITKLLTDNPKFVRDLTEMIEKQININTNGAYNKEKSLNKF